MRLNWSTQVIAVLGIVHGRRNGFERDIDNLQDAELNVLLQGSRRAEINGASNSAIALGESRSPL